MPPPLHEVQAFKFYFSDGQLLSDVLDDPDGSCTPREVLTRFLLLMAVLDQGPDIQGLRRLLVDVTNTLYRREIRFLHRPADFFREIGVSVDQIIEKHKTVSDARKDIWAQENQSAPSRYNLFKYDRDQTKPLHFAVARWGVPMLLPLFLASDPNPACNNVGNEDNPNILMDYLESWPSAEKMSTELKTNERYGLGKAIGDKACHLFTKWIVDTFSLSRKTAQGDNGWSRFSYEVPYDSNAGRVLWRTGYLLFWAELKDYGKWNVIQRNAGKSGTDYLRVTNLRKRTVSRNHFKALLSDKLWETYLSLQQNYFGVSRTRVAQIQRLQHVFLLEHSIQYPDDILSVAHFDDGLIYIGTNFCYNHDNPKCSSCPLGSVCVGNVKDRHLISGYRT